jgi:hypothetical protein
MGLRPTQGDEKRLLSSNRSLWKRAQQEIRVCSVEKHFQERSAELQIPRLRSG